MLTRFAWRSGSSRKLIDRRRLWYEAICDAAGHPFGNADAAEDEESNLLVAGLPLETAGRLLELGGAPTFAPTWPDSALRCRSTPHLLEHLHHALVERGDVGLVIKAGTDALRSWRARYGRYVAAVLELSSPPPMQKSVWNRGRLTQP